MGVPVTYQFSVHMDKENLHNRHTSRTAGSRVFDRREYRDLPAGKRGAATPYPGRGFLPSPAHPLLSAAEDLFVPISRIPRKVQTMYEKVLVPFDFSPDSKHALECLKSIPYTRHVLLLHVVYTKHPSVPGEFENPDTDYARLRLEEYVRSLGNPGFAIGIRVEEISGGNISDVVNRVAAAEGISLTVMGRRGQGVIEALLLGSVASDVLRYGTTDLLLTGRPRKELSGDAKPPCMDLFSHVIICTDFSAPDIVALACGRLPRPRRVSLLHVVSHGESEDEVQKFTRSAWTELEKCAGAFSSRHVPVATAVRVGSTAEEIAAFSEKEGATLIVMKSAGKRGFIPSFIGTTTAHVARAARVPVLVLKQPAVAPE